MLTVIIHNIDGPNLRNERSQGALAELASIPNFFLVCSIDHINSGLLWDVTKHTLFNFSFHDTTTFETMIVETTFENRLISSDQVNNCSRAIVVLQSLNNNALEVFKILLKNQLENNGEGLSYATFFRLAHQDFLASSDIAFKTLLTEFRDHQLIVGKKVQQVEVLSIPYSKENLIEISEQLKTLE
jgi:origin recognition complex subunit 2